MKKYSLILFFICQLGFSQNQNISGGFVFDGEPYLAIHPANSQHITVAWIGYSLGQPVGIKTKVSTNGGATWSAAQFLPHGGPTLHSADPSLDYDNAGNLWACYIDYVESPDSGGIYVVKSTDGGFTWMNFTKALDMYADGLEKPVDRPWMAINPVNNHMYITSKPPPWVLAPNRNYLTKSYDGGINWEPWRYCDTTGYLIGNLIAQPMAALDAGPDGRLHIMYPTYETSQNILPGYIHASSTNSGNSFSYHPAIYAIPGAQDTLIKAGYNLKVDPSDPDHLAFAYTFRPNGGDADVQIIESTNGGITWTSAIRVNDDPIGNGKMQDLVWCDFDTDGDLIVGWRDRRNASGTGYSVSSDIWGAVKWKDSINFSANFRIADSLANYQAVLSENGNDFMNIAMRNDTMYAVWGDVRTGVLQIWFAKRDLITGVTSVEQITSEQIPTFNIYPNPVKDFLYYNGMEVLQIDIYDMSGKIKLQTKPLQNNQPIDISQLPTGSYIATFTTINSKVSKKIIKQ
jgi:hypothetical protein